MVGGVVTVSETQMTGKELGSKTVSRSSRSPGASQRTLGTLVRGPSSQGALQREVLAALQPWRPESDWALTLLHRKPCGDHVEGSRDAVSHLPMPRPLVPSCSLVRQQQNPDHNFERKAAL